VKNKAWWFRRQRDDANTPVPRRCSGSRLVSEVQGTVLPMMSPERCGDQESSRSPVVLASDDGGCDDEVTRRGIVGTIEVGSCAVVSNAVRPSIGC